MSPGSPLMPETELLPGPISGFTDLLQLGPVLISMANDTTKGQEDAGLHGVGLAPHWIRGMGDLTLPLTSVTLRREGPIPHLGGTIELTIFLGAWASCPREYESGRAVPAASPAVWWHAKERCLPPCFHPPPRLHHQLQHLVEQKDPSPLLGSTVQLTL